MSSYASAQRGAQPARIDNTEPVQGRLSLQRRAA